MKTHHSSDDLNTDTPILALGGEVNTLAMARHLGPKGVRISVSGEHGCYALSSRWCSEALPVPQGMSSHDYWFELLLAPGADRYRDHIVMAMNDDAIDFVAKNAESLRGRCRLERFVPELRRALLDKQKTLELAEQVGVPAPRHWAVKGPEDVLAAKDEITFPVMVKPIHSHEFVQAFGRKLFIIKNDFDEVVARVRDATDRSIEVMAVEMVPGPDDLLSSYYTYLDDRGEPLYHFTKRIIRRHPVNRGGAVYHATEWLPETAEMGLRFLQGIGWRGMANIEFKRDTRDGQLKIIEVNSRLTAAHPLALRSGAPLDLIQYCVFTGQAHPTFGSYKEGMFYWYPLRDFRAFLELKRAGELSFWEWLSSLPRQNVVLPLFNLSDLSPSLRRAVEIFGGLGRKVRASVK